jgi:[ribosomal protein S5]-alanine N-acetyltransferase
MEIKLKNCTLRGWRVGDEHSLALHANNYKIWRNVRDRFPHPYTLEDARRWIEHASSEDPLTNFAIVMDGAAVGGIGLIFHDDIYHRSAEIGYWLGEAYWGRGLTTEAVRGVVEWAFDNFDLARIYAGILEWNPASARVLEKAGFQFEARLRRAVTKENHTMDELLYALVRE